MVTLDFSECKNKEDVEKVFRENHIIPAKKIMEALSDLDKAVNKLKDKEVSQ